MRFDTNFSIISDIQQTQESGTPLQIKDNAKIAIKPSLNEIEPLLVTEVEISNSVGDYQSNNNRNESTANKGYVPAEGFVTTEVVSNMSASDFQEDERNVESAKTTILLKDALNISEEIVSVKEAPLHDSSTKKSTATVAFSPLLGLNVTEINEEMKESNVEAVAPGKTATSKLNFNLLESLQVGEVFVEDKSGKYYPELIVPTETARKDVLVSNQVITEVHNVQEREGILSSLKLPPTQEANVDIASKDSLVVFMEELHEKEGELATKEMPSQVSINKDILLHTGLSNTVTTAHIKESEFIPTTATHKKATIGINELQHKFNLETSIHDSETNFDESRPVIGTHADIAISALDKNTVSVVEVHEKEKDLIIEDDKQTAKADSDLKTFESFITSEILEMTSTDEIKLSAKAVKEAATETVITAQAKIVTYPLIHDKESIKEYQTKKPEIVTSSLIPNIPLTVSETEYSESEDKFNMNKIPDVLHAQTSPSHSLQTPMSHEINTADQISFISKQPNMTELASESTDLQKEITVLQTTVAEQLQNLQENKISHSAAQTSFIGQESLNITEIIADVREHNLDTEKLKANSFAKIDIDSDRKIAIVMEVSPRDTLDKLDTLKLNYEEAQIRSNTLIPLQISENEILDSQSILQKESQPDMKVIAPEIVSTEQIVKITEIVQHEKESDYDITARPQTFTALTDITGRPVAMMSEITVDSSVGFTGDITTDSLKQATIENIAHRELIVSTTNYNEKENILETNLIPKSASAACNIDSKEAVAVEENKSEILPEVFEKHSNLPWATANPSQAPITSEAITQQEVLVHSSEEKLICKESTSAKPQISLTTLLVPEQDEKLMIEKEDIFSTPHVPDKQKADYSIICQQSLQTSEITSHSDNIDSRDELVRNYSTATPSIDEIYGKTAHTEEIFTSQMPEEFNDMKIILQKSSITPIVKNTVEQTEIVLGERENVIQEEKQSKSIVKSHFSEIDAVITTYNETIDQEKELDTKVLQQKYDASVTFVPFSSSIDTEVIPSSNVDNFENASTKTINALVARDDLQKHIQRTEILTGEKECDFIDSLVDKHKAIAKVIEKTAKQITEIHTMETENKIDELPKPYSTTATSMLTEKQSLLRTEIVVNQGTGDLELPKIVPMCAQSTHGTQEAVEKNITFIGEVEDTYEKCLQESRKPTRSVEEQKSVDIIEIIATESELSLDDRPATKSETVNLTIQGKKHVSVTQVTSSEKEDSYDNEMLPERKIIKPILDVSLFSSVDVNETVPSEKETNLTSASDLKAQYVEVIIHPTDSLNVSENIAGEKEDTLKDTIMPRGVTNDVRLTTHKHLNVEFLQTAETEDNLIKLEKREEAIGDISIEAVKPIIVHETKYEEQTTEMQSMGKTHEYTPSINLEVGQHLTVTEAQVREKEHPLEIKQSEILQKTEQSYTTNLSISTEEIMYKEAEGILTHDKVPQKETTEVVIEPQQHVTITDTLVKEKEQDIAPISVPLSGKQKVDIKSINHITTTETVPIEDYQVLQDISIKDEKAVPKSVVLKELIAMQPQTLENLNSFNKTSIGKIEKADESHVVCQELFNVKPDVIEKIESLPTVSETGTNEASLVFESHKSYTVSENIPQETSKHISVNKEQTQEVTEQLLEMKPIEQTEIITGENISSIKIIDHERVNIQGSPISMRPISQSSVIVHENEIDTSFENAVSLEKAALTLGIMESVIINEVTQGDSSDTFKSDQIKPVTAEKTITPLTHVLCTENVYETQVKELITPKTHTETTKITSTSMTPLIITDSEIIQQETELHILKPKTQKINKSYTIANEVEVTAGFVDEQVAIYSEKQPQLLEGKITITDDVPRDIVSELTPFVQEITEALHTSPKTSDTEESEEIITKFIKGPGNSEPIQIKTKRTILRKKKTAKTLGSDEGDVVIEETLEDEEPKQSKQDVLHDLNIEEYEGDEAEIKQEMTEKGTIEMPEEELHIPKMVSQIEIEEIIDEDTDQGEIPIVSVESTEELTNNKTAKRIIKKRKGTKQEVGEITTLKKDEKEPIITIISTEEKSAEGPKETVIDKDEKAPVTNKVISTEIFELPEEITFEKCKAPNGESKHKKVTKRVIKKRVGSRLETTEIVTEQEENQQPIVMIHKTEEVTDETITPFTDFVGPNQIKQVEEIPETIQVTQIRTETGDVQTVKTTKRVIKKKKGPKEEVTEITTIERGDEAPITTVMVTEEKPSEEYEETKPIEIIELPEEYTVEESKTSEGKRKQKKTSKRIYKKKIGPKLETTEIVTEQEEDKQPIISIYKTETLTDETTVPLLDLHKFDKARQVEEAPEKIVISQVRTETGEVQTIKTTKRIIKKKKGPKQEVTEIVTIEKEDEEPITTVNITEDETPTTEIPENLTADDYRIEELIDETSIPLKDSDLPKKALQVAPNLNETSEIFELPEDITVKETKTSEGPTKHKKNTKRIIKKKTGPEVETTEFISEQENDKTPTISLYKPEELADDTMITVVNDMHELDAAKLIEEVPETVLVTQVRTDTGEIKTIKTTKRTIKKKKGSKKEITEITSIQTDNEEPVTTITVTDESDDTKPVEIIELPEETTVEESRAPDGQPKKKKITVRTIKKKVGRKLETTEIITEQNDEEEPIVSIQTQEELVEDTTLPLHELHEPDKAQVITEVPEVIQVTQVRTESGDVKTVKTTKRVIKKKRGPKEEITEITVVQEGDEAPVTTVTVTEDKATEKPEETEPIEIVELPEDITIEESKTPEGKLKQKKTIKRIIKKKVGPKVETTQITTEYEDNEQPVVKVHKTEEIIDNSTTPITDLPIPDRSQVLEEAPETVQMSQIRTENGEIKTVKTTKRVIKKKQGPKEEITEITTVEKDNEVPITTVNVIKDEALEEYKPIEIIELPEETTIEKSETPDGKPKQKKITKRTIKKKVGQKIETTHIITEQEDDKQPTLSIYKTEELTDDTTIPLADLLTPAKPNILEEAPETVTVTQVRTDTGDIKTVKTTKRVIKKNKGPKKEITELTTIENENEVPITTVMITEDTITEKPEEIKPIDVFELPEEIAVEEYEGSDVGDEEKNQKIPRKEENYLAEDVPENQDKKDVVKKKTPKKLKAMSIQIEKLELTEAQHAKELPFTKLKLKKPVQKPKEEVKTALLPKIQLKSRIKRVDDWPPMELTPQVTYLGSVRQNGQLSRNIKEAAKLKKKPNKTVEIPDLEKVELEKPEVFNFTKDELEEKRNDFEEIPQQFEASIEESAKPVSQEKLPIQQDELPKETSKEQKPETGEAQSLQKTDIQQTIPMKPDEIPEELPKQHKPESKEVEPVQKHDIQEKISTKRDEELIGKPDSQQTLPIRDKLVEESPKLRSPESEKILPVQRDELPSLLVNETKGTQPIQKQYTEEFEKPKTVTDEVGTAEDKEKSHETYDDKGPNIDESKSPIKDKKVKKLKKNEKVDRPIVQDEISEETHVNDIVVEEPESKPIVEEFEDTNKLPTEDGAIEKRKEVKKKPKKSSTGNAPEIKPEEILQKTDYIEPDDKTDTKKPIKKLTLMKIERKELEVSKPQHAESIEGPQFTKLKLKKSVPKPKIESTEVKLPKFQLKSRIKYVLDWPPEIIKPLLTHLGSVRQNGILSRNVKEAEKIKKKIYKEPKLPEIEKTELEKPQFGYEDIEDAKRKPESFEQEEPLDISTQPLNEEGVEVDEPEQYTIKPKRPSIKKTEEIEDEVTIKKKLKAVRKPSITLPEITEPETVTFRPKTTKTKEDVEQEFNIHLDSYAEEEISMTSKVKLKPFRQPTFSEEADQASIKFYEERDEDDKQDVIEILESDEENNSETANIMVPLKKPKRVKEISKLEDSEITSSVTVTKPKIVDNESEVMQEVSIKLERQPQYKVDEQEEVSFDVKAHSEQYTQEELSLSSKIKLKPKKRITVSEAADETSIQLKQEIEDDSQVEEIILSEAESEENVELFIKRKSRKPKYEVSEVEELSIDLKPKRTTEQSYEEEELTISAKRKPRKPTKIQEADVSMSIAREQEFPETPLDVRSGDTVFAVYSYVAETDEAINLVEGERLYILETTNQDWWFVRKHLTEEKGWVPAQYLMDEANYTLYLQKKLNEKIDKLPVFEKPTPEEQAIAPIFIEKLRPKHTPDGSTVQFECQVEGYPRPQITWFRQTAIIKPSQDFQMYYDDDNVATLVIREVFPEDAGTFTCVAKNAAGFASSTTELIVEAPLSDHGSEMTILSRKSLSRESSLADILEGIPPTFSKRPKAQYVDEGSQIFLECRLVAIPEPDIAWFFKGEEIIPTDNISIATESDMHMYCSVLKISNVKKLQEGTYTVLATNREGEASLPIVLKIKTGQKEKPQVIEPLKSMTIREGESVVLSTQVVGNPQPTVTWYKNNKPIKSLVTKSDGDTHTVTIIKPKKGKDDGVYTLKAINSEGTTETTAVINIEEPTEENAEPPLFINRFQEITVKEKGTIKLIAKVTGNPVPSITWYRNNNIITPSETVTQNFDGENIELIITNVDSEIDSGDYKCVASNSAGKASHGARVTIDVDKVTFVKNLNSSYETEEGKTVILECHTSHTVSTKWYHNDKEVSGMDHREIIQEGRVHKLRIKKTKLIDIGTIKCIVKGQETTTKLIVHETIPEFIRRLQDFEVKERDIAILEVEINSETADVIWEKDGEKIKSKKNKFELEKRGNVRKLLIRNTSVHDEGEYTCRLRDDSCTAEVTVVELPPEIISRLQDQKVNKGNKATFEIELTKGDALVQWFKDGSEIQFSNHMQLTIDGKKQKLKIYDCELSDAGTYACEVGNDKCTAKLTVEQPSIDFVLRLPEVIVVPANTDAYMTVEIPDETLEVTWYKKKSVIEDTEKFTLISDVTKRTLIVRKCTEEDQCEYSCMLLDAKCTSKLKVEVVEFSPKIIEYESEYRVKRGGDVTLNVLYEALPQPNDEWIVNSKIIKKSKHTKPTIDSKSASLTIKKVERTDAGNYRLRLENNCGEATIEIHIIVIDVPSPPGKPNILAISNNSVSLCWNEPENKGNSEIDCYIVEYQEIDTAEWTSIENVKKIQYTVENLKKKSSYRFRVFAVNEVGVSESSEITEFILVEEILKALPPSVEKPLKDIIKEPNEDIELTCIFGGIPEPKVAWFKDGKKLKTAKATYVNRVATLIVTGTETRDGKYSCIASNEHGEIETSCTVEVQQKPIIKVADEEVNQKLKVGEQWCVTAYLEGIPQPVTNWYINGSKVVKSNNIQVITEEDVSMIKITELDRSHTGRYTIEAQNKGGSTSFDVTLKVYDKPSKPEGPVVMREISRESVTIEWKPPLDDGGLELTKYAIEKHEPDTNKWVKVADVDKDVETYCIQRLNENCEYMFRVMAQNPIGFSEALESEPIVIKTALDVPSPPLGPLGLYGINNDSLTITWYPSEKNGGSPIIDYSVEIKQEGKKWKNVSTVTETKTIVKKLTVNVTYQFRICARNEIGTSLPYVSDEKITIGKTLSPPSQPQNFVVREITSRSVTLQWTAPESDGGSVVTNYVIEYKTVKSKSWTKVITVSGSVYEHCIENIKEKDELVFRISAENAIGISLPTESKTVRLEKHATVPSPPTAPLEIRTIGNNIVMTSWGTPEWDGGAPLLGYNIAIRDVTKTMWMEVGKVDANTLKFNIKDLSENHTYMIRIYARNEIGLSEPLESDEPFKVVPGEDSHADEEIGEQTEMTEPTSFSTQTTTSWMREYNMDADIRSYARGSLLRRDEYFFRIWHYAKQLFK